MSLFVRFFRFVRLGLKWKKILLLRGNSGKKKRGILVVSNNNVRIFKIKLGTLISN